MKVRQLIRKLEKLDQNAKIFIDVLDDDWNAEGGIFGLPIEPDIYVAGNGDVAIQTYVDVEETGSPADDDEDEEDEG